MSNGAFDPGVFDDPFDTGTITYPLSLPAVPAPRSLEWSPLSVVARFPSPFSLQQQVQAHQGQLWRVRISLPPMIQSTAAAWIGRLLALNGMQGTFLFGDSVLKAPRGSAGGTPLVKGANQTGQQLLTDGWPAATLGVLLEGDWIQLGSGVLTRLHQVMTNTSTDSGGNAAINIWPRLRESPADNAPIVLSAAKGTFRLADNIMDYSVSVAKHYGLEIDAVEAI